MRVLCACVQWVNDTIPNLLYNSEYLFDVEYVADRAKHSANVTLITPGCSELIAGSFKRCAVVGQPPTGASARRLLHLFRSLSVSSVLSSMPCLCSVSFMLTVVLASVILIRTNCCTISS